MSSSTTLKLYVSPQSTDPKAFVNERNAPGDGMDTIRWVKDADADDFDFIGFAPFNDGLPNPFQNIKINKNRIKCDFDDTGSGDKYEYTVVIEHGGVAKNTDDPTAGPSDGKAVIRN